MGFPNTFNVFMRKISAASPASGKMLMIICRVYGKYSDMISGINKQFGEKLGFLGKTSDVRITQYESEVRVPKADFVKEMSDLLDVDPRALTVPDIDTQLGLMHTLFAIEDMYGLKIDELDTHQFSVDVLPKEISDALIKEETKKSKSKKK